MSNSIIIANYNYAHYLADAIESALHQPCSDVEVIVVDDGSTDGSGDVIARYGGQIVAIRKENGGHSSAVNAGFAVAKGDLVCLLDSDDLFLPDKSAAVVQAWSENKDACIIYNQLQAVDAHKVAIGRPWPTSVWRGSIRHRVERSGGWWPHPTTSGLCFPRAFLERVMPMPDDRQTFPDTYLAGLAAFAGPVVGIRSSLTLSRFHGNNMSLVHTPRNDDDAERLRTVLRQSLVQYEVEFETLKRSLDERLGITSFMSLDDHWVHQRRQMVAGDNGSLLSLLWSVGSCPAMTPSLKARELVKILTNRW